MDDNMKEFAEFLRTLGDVKVQNVYDPHDLESGGREILLVPHGYTAQSIKPLLDEYLTQPRRRKGVAHVTDLQSFVALAQRGADPNSAIFADRRPTSASLTAVLNYNPPTATDTTRRGRFGDHRVVYNFPVSAEWKAWVNQSGKEMAQREFASFIEGRVLDLVDPPAGAKKDEPVMVIAKKLGGTFALQTEMVMLSKGMKINVNETVQEILDIGSGQTQVAYTQSHVGDRGKPLKVPSLFLIAIPVFDKGVLYLMAARLLYRKDETRLVWKYDLYQPEKSFDNAFDEAASAAAIDTRLPLFYGSPES